MDVLGKHRCSFRLDDGVLDIDAEPPANSELHSLQKHPLGLPFVNVTFDNDSVQACWDTGASRSGVDLGWAQRHTHLVTVGNNMAGHDGVGAELEVWEAELAACSIGGVAFTASSCVVIDLAPINDRIGQSIDVIIGIPLIRQANWWFDFPRQLWAVQEP